MQQPVSNRVRADNLESTLPLFKWGYNQPTQPPERHRALSAGGMRVRRNHPFLSDAVANLTAELIGLGQGGDWS